MSIPDRVYRIAKHKLGEMKDWFDKVDDEEDQDTDSQRRRDARTDARRELNDALAPTNNAATTTPTPGASSIIRPTGQPTGVRPTSAIPVASPRATGSVPPSGRAPQTTQTVSPEPDPLDYHYRLLSLEPGADLTAVQLAYNRLSARCDPSKFPAGSAEERQAIQIRERLDASYKELRTVLDTTATRFGRLEF